MADNKPTDDKSSLGFKPKKGKPDYDAIISAASKDYGVDADLIRSVLKQESGGNHKIVSAKGAQGLMQLMPETAKSLGVKDVFDPNDNIRGGTKLLKQLLDRYKGDVSKSLAAYNAGPDAVDNANGIPKIKETQDYVSNIMKDYNNRRGMSEVDFDSIAKKYGASGGGTTNDEKNSLGFRPKQKQSGVLPPSQPQPQPQQDKPGFSQRFAEGTPGVQEAVEASQRTPLENLKEQAKELPWLATGAAPLKMLYGAGKNAAEQLYQGGKDIYQEGVNIGKGIANKDTSDTIPSLVRAALTVPERSAKAIPGGEQVWNFGQDVGEGNWKGAAGGATAALTQAALGHAVFGGGETPEETPSTPKSIPKKEPFVGRHFSDAKVKNGILSGTRRGSSMVGAETGRLTAGKGAAPGVYAYREGAVAEPQIGSRPNEYYIHGSKALAAVEEEPWKSTFQKHLTDTGDRNSAINATEHSIRDMGYDGYYSKSSPGSVFLYGDQKAALAGELPKSPAVSATTVPAEKTIPFTHNTGPENINKILSEGLQPQELTDPYAKAAAKGNKGLYYSSGETQSYPGDFTNARQYTLEGEIPESQHKGSVTDPELGEGAFITNKSIPARAIKKISYTHPVTGETVSQTPEEFMRDNPQQDPAGLLTQKELNYRSMYKNAKTNAGAIN